VGDAPVPVWIREGGGPSVLVVHGGPELGSGYLRHHLPPAMPEEATLVFLDLPGTGRSPAPAEGVRFAAMVQALTRLLERQGSPAFVLGHSFGSLPALALAADVPGLVRGLILVDPDPPWHDVWEGAFTVLDGRRGPEERDALARLEATTSKLASADSMRAYLRLRLRAYFFDPRRSSSFEPDLDPGALERFAGGSSVRRDPECLAVARRLPEVVSPVCLVTGPASVYPEGALERLRAALPDAAIRTIPRTGHFPFIEEPMRFRTLVGQFLGSVSLPAMEAT